MLGEDEFLELTGKQAAPRPQPQPSAAALKAAALRASNSAFAGDSLLMHAVHSLAQVMGVMIVTIPACISKAPMTEAAMRRGGSMLLDPMFGCMKIMNCLSLWVLTDDGALEEAGLHLDCPADRRGRQGGQVAHAVILKCPAATLKIISRRFPNKNIPFVGRRGKDPCASAGAADSGAPGGRRR